MFPVGCEPRDQRLAMLQHSSAQHPLTGRFFEAEIQARTLVSGGCRPLSDRQQRLVARLWRSLDAKKLDVALICPMSMYLAHPFPRELVRSCLPFVLKSLHTFECSLHMAQFSSILLSSACTRRTRIDSAETSCCSIRNASVTTISLRSNRHLICSGAPRGMKCPLHNGEFSIGAHDGLEINGVH